MSAEEIAQNENANVDRASVPASGLSLPAPLCDGDTLVDTLDIVVLIQVLYDTLSGRKVTPLETWRRLQARGIRSTKNRKELVGKNSVYESYSRLIDAGYIERYEKPNEKPGRKGSIAYRVYDNPAWNPVWQAQHVGVDPLETGKSDFTKPQVGTLPGTGDPAFREVGGHDETAGRDASRNWGSGVPGSGVPGSGKRVIPAGRNASPVPGSGKASPPLPPGGGTTPPPTPSPDGARQHPSQREEEVVFDAEELAAAEAFLQQLPDPWVVGKADAAEMAPQLLRRMRAEGWPTILATDLSLLAKCTATNPGGARDLVSILRTKRIPNLPPYARVMARSARTQTSRPAKVIEMPADEELSTRPITSVLDGILDRLQKPSI